MKSTNSILLGVTGGIAAYKSAEIIRRLQDQGITVRVVMTASAEKFIGKVTLQALSGFPVHTDMFVSDARVMEHIDLARWADKILIAPASADFLAKLAHGHADNLLSTLCLAAKCPIYLAPTMNHAMWENPATQHNIQWLNTRGYRILTPESGDQACGETGTGRLRETKSIIQAILNDEPSLLKGKKILITAGPTREAIDPVRFISNHSSGKTGYALARQAERAGAQVTLISGPVNLLPPANIKTFTIESAAEMYAAVHEQLEGTDIFIAAAAVADYRPQATANNKIKKTHSSMEIKLQRNPDILSSVASHPEIFCVGFAAETENLIDNAQKKLHHKKLDMIVANRVGKKPDGSYQGFHVDHNTLTIITKDTQNELSENDKNELAKQLIQHIAEHYEKKHTS